MRTSSFVLQFFFLCTITLFAPESRAVDTLLLVESGNYYRDGSPSLFSTYEWQLHQDGSKTSIKRSKSQDKWQEGFLISRYDAKGNLVSEQRYMNPDYLYVTRTKKYDGLGRLILDSLDYDYKDHISREIFTYTYTGKNLTLLTIRRPWLEGNMTFEYTYDKDDRLIRHMEYDSVGSVHFRNTYEYGPGPDSSRMIRQNSHDDTIMVFAYRYDGIGNILRKREIQPLGRGGETITTNYEYDSFGNKIREERNSDKSNILNPVTTWVYRNLNLVPVLARRQMRQVWMPRHSTHSIDWNLLGRFAPRGLFSGIP